MKLFASGGTDGANIVLFWPDHLPEDADRVLQQDPIDLVERLHQEGRLIWFPCDGDGSYTLVCYVNESIPPELQDFCEDEEVYEELFVSGDAYFGGLEYMFKHDSSLMEKYSGMLERIEIPDGVYSSSVFRTNMEHSFRIKWLIERAGMTSRWTWLVHNWTIALAVIGVITSIVTPFFTSVDVWSVVLAVTFAMMLTTKLSSGSEAYKSYLAAMKEYDMAYPDYVMKLDLLA